LAALVGVEELIVIATADAVLAAAHAKSDDVKVLVEQLRLKVRPEASLIGEYTLGHY
jgi:hypothetical protein